MSPVILEQYRGSPRVLSKQRTKLNSDCQNGCRKSNGLARLWRILIRILKSLQVYCNKRQKCQLDHLTDDLQCGDLRFSSCINNGN